MEKDNEAAVANIREILLEKCPKLLIWKLTKYIDGIWSPGLMADRVAPHEVGEKDYEGFAADTTSLLHEKGQTSGRNIFSVSFWS